MNLLISEIQVTPVKPQNGLVAFSSCAINNSLYLGCIALYTAPDHPLGYRTVFPTKRLQSGQQIPCFYPFKKEAEEALKNAIVTKYLEVMNNFIND